MVRRPGFTPRSAPHLLAPQLLHELLHLGRPLVLPLLAEHGRPDGGGRLLDRQAIDRLAIHVGAVVLQPAKRIVRGRSRRARGRSLPAAGWRRDARTRRRARRRPLAAVAASLTSTDKSLWLVRTTLKLLDEAGLLSSERVLLLLALRRQLLLALLEGCLLCAAQAERRQLVCRHRPDGPWLDGAGLQPKRQLTAHRTRLYPDDTAAGTPRGF
eukprot:scaffold17300_cov94-Isochrysis_galbana.AAC.4